MQGKKASSMCPILGETKITKRVGTQPVEIQPPPFYRMEPQKVENFQQSS